MMHHQKYETVAYRNTITHWKLEDYGQTVCLCPNDSRRFDLFLSRNESRTYDNSQILYIPIVASLLVIRIEYDAIIDAQKHIMQW